MPQSSSATPHTPQSDSSSRTARNARIVIIVAALIVVLALVSAFLWPGWAVRRTPTPVDVPSASASATPTISPQALPEDASQLVKALPDHVSNYVRESVESTDVWKSSSPVEAYSVVYGTGDDAKNVTVTVGQWSDAQSAAEQFDALAKALQGDQVASGNIKVSGANAGSYAIVTNKDNPDIATGLWRNDTVVFQAVGPTSGVEILTKLFPM